MGIKQNTAKREIFGVAGICEIPHFVGVSMSLSSCVVQKNIFLEKRAPYTRDAYACKWSGSRAEKLKIFSSRSKWRPNFKIQPGIICYYHI